MISQILTTDAVTAYRDRINKLIGTTPIAGLPVLDVGQPGQIRAGRDLTVADFTTLLGLTQPTALFNLGSLANLGSGPALTDRGTVAYAPGVTGAAGTAAQFTGTNPQGLFISDSGAADATRLRTGSFGGWFRTAKTGTNQALITKQNSADTVRSFSLIISPGNVLQSSVSLDGSTWNVATGATTVTDDRWHHVVVTFDGSTLRLYLDAVPEAAAVAVGQISQQGVPFSLGAFGVDTGVAGGFPLSGRLDEVFLTRDVLAGEQIRLLYAAKIAHGGASQPNAARIAVQRRRRGGALAPADFPSTPLRLYNFTGATLTDQGTNNQALTANVGTGVITDGPGVDGTRGNARLYSGTHQGDSATDAGLPSGTSTRSYGCWFKVPYSTTATYCLLSWGSTTAGTALNVLPGSSALTSYSGNLSSSPDAIAGPYAGDLQWHFGVVVENNAATDGIKRKLYLDGRVVGGSTTLPSITLVGANGLRIGVSPFVNQPATGQLDGAFVTGTALTSEQVWALYQKPGLTFPAAPKDAAEHIEAFDATNAYVIFDSVEPQHTIDLRMAT
jgi:hypothetical protein